ncbi:MAG TPA: hypothetical protein VH061_14940 [Solirubrobacteraceae bacterium]|nr:hypothetical protein [Solirubrobacteraceae bacterium]
MAVTACLTACAAVAPDARAAQQTLTASQGSVRATVTYEAAHREPGTRPLTGLRLAIERDGAKLYEAAVSSSHCSPCGLESLADEPLKLADLESNGQPDVVLGLNTGGAHCCSIVQVFAYDPGTMTYRVTERDFGEPGVDLIPVGTSRQLVFRTGDARFAYTFAPYAYSGLPIQLVSFEAGAFRDATLSYPAEIAADAALYLGGFRAERRHGLGNGLIAAWAADEDRLGHGALVRRILDREARHGLLRSREHYGPSGHAFVQRLLRFLKRTGYG